jgi:FkbM family methyltransferase
LYALLQNPECRVVAIEPSPASLERLRALLKTHQVDSRCTVVHGALGSGEGVTTIADCGGSQFRRTGCGGLSVPMLGLDAALPAGEIDFLKMDIEGAEYDTLGAASPAALERVRRIALEYHPVDNSPHPWPALRETLLSAGFRITAEEDDGGGYGLAYLQR